jgi:hypothetical protein
MFSEFVHLSPRVTRPGHDANNPMAQQARRLAIGLLASGIPIKAGGRMLREAWEINHVPIEVILTDREGFELCGPHNMRPAPEALRDGPPGVPEGANVAGLPPKEWLTVLLSGGAVNSNRIHAQARASGLSAKSILKAKDALGVVAFQQGRRWYWRLPGQGSEDRDFRAPRALS